HAWKTVGAPFATHFDDRVQPTRKRPEKLGIVGNASHLAANGGHLSTRALAELEGKPLHGVKIGHEAVTASTPVTIENLGAQDRTARARYVDSSLLQEGKVFEDSLDQLRIGNEPGLRRSPTLCPRMLGARTHQCRLVFEAHPTKQLFGCLGAASQCARPGFG